jgi:hypothetical protein
MKISAKEFRKACGYKGKKKGKAAADRSFSSEEIRMLKEILKQMPERAVRHLNFAQLKEECAKASSEDVAEKLLMRSLIDSILGKG